MRPSRGPHGAAPIGLSAASLGALSSLSWGRPRRRPEAPGRPREVPPAKKGPLERSAPTGPGAGGSEGPGAKRPSQSLPRGLCRPSCRRAGGIIARAVELATSSSA
eukprot:7040116-Pyramimonas_sp.AAC.1